MDDLITNVFSCFLSQLRPRPILYGFINQMTDFQIKSGLKQRCEETVANSQKTRNNNFTPSSDSLRLGGLKMILYEQ